MLGFGMKWLRKSGILRLVILAASVGASCGGRTSGTEVTMAGIARSTIAAQTSKVELLIEGVDGESIRIEGRVDFSREIAELSGISQLREESMSEFELRLTEDFVFQRGSEVVFSEGVWDAEEDWIRIPRDVPIQLGLPIPDPTDIFEEVKSSDKLKKVGTEVIRGHGAVHYRLDLSAAAGESLPEDLGAEASETIVVGVWVDSEERIVRLQILTNHASFQVEYFDFGIPVVIDT